MKHKYVVVAATLMLALAFPVTLVAAELENPARGAIRQIFNVKVSEAGGNHSRYLENFANAARQIYRGAETAISTCVDDGEAFTTLSKDSYRRDIGMWRGCLQRKNGGVYTIVMSTDGGTKFPLYSVWVNGRQYANAQANTFAFDVELKAGFNSICIIAHGWERYSTFLSIKRKDSLKDPVFIGPGDFWHEDELDDEDEDEEDEDW